MGGDLPTSGRGFVSRRIRMTILHRIKIRSYELGLVFRDGEFVRLMGPGRRWLFDPLARTHVEIVSQRAPWLVHEQLDQIIKSGALAGRALVLDLKDHERALVWIDGRFSHILPPGQHAFWTRQREGRAEVVDRSEERRAGKGWSSRRRPKDAQKNAR